MNPPAGGWTGVIQGGLMHTAGLRQAGAPCNDEGEELGLHGRICNIPAENVYADGVWEEDEYRVFVRGTLRETSALGENLVMTRRVSAALGGKSVMIEDEVRNAGRTTSPLMILYHTNFGFPLIDEGSRLIIPVKEVLDAFSLNPVDKQAYAVYREPSDTAEQHIYFHKTIEKRRMERFHCCE